MTTIQKTFRGKTAGGWIKYAEISKMQAGTSEITVPALPGCILILTEDKSLAVIDYDGLVVMLQCSNRAAAKLQRLTNIAEEI